MPPISEPADGITSPKLVAALGASAGGLEACKRLLAGVPDDQGIAVVVVTHLDPDQQSHIADFLGRVTSATVRQAVDGERVEGNHVYVIAPATSLTIHEGTLRVTGQERPRYRTRPIDDFFSALAADQGERAVGIVLSGTGNDGAAGLEAIHAAGGLCLVQDPATAEYDGMPTAAVHTGVADAVLPPEAMAEALLEFATPVHARPRKPPAPPAAGPGEEAPAGFAGILALLGKQYHVDFTEYKSGTLARRTARRMGLKRIGEWDEYLDYLRGHPEELAALYSGVLIDVTRFFRDPETWEYLEREVIPELLATHESDRPIRVWSAGCASGEEAYGLAMVFLEQIEKRRSGHGLQVFGSDLSHEALEVARRGAYTGQIAEDVSAERLRRFFARTGEHYQVNQSLRELVTFAAHNLLSDPPFAGLDLVACRNVLIYLQPHAQERLLELFHFALRPKGVLWLGRSETVGRRSDLYENMPGAHRLYRTVPSTRPARHAMPRWVADRTPIKGFVPQPEAPPRQVSVARALERFVLEHRSIPSVAINRNLEILHFFGPLEPYLKQPSGEARMDFLSWVRRGSYARLRAGVLEAVKENKTLTVTNLRIGPGRSGTRTEAVIEPVVVPGAEGVFLVTFRDVLPARELAEDTAEANETLVHDLEQELRDTQLDLQGTVEQLETVNEEYRASHEELLSLNEELQSSNEELEMSKEELQALNEELTTVNHQLEARNEELRTLSADLNNLLVNADVPILFLDRDLCIRRFTPACTRMMRIVETDIGRSIDHVRLEVRDDDLLADARRVLERLSPVEVELHTEDGRWILRRIVAYRAEDDRIDGVCITFQDVTAHRRAAEESEEARAFSEAIIRSSPVPTLVLDADLEVVRANRAFYETFRTCETDTDGHRFLELDDHQWDTPGLRAQLQRVLTRHEEVHNYDVEHDFPRIGKRAMRLNATPVPLAKPLILLKFEDITDLRRAREAARERTEELVQEHRRKDEFLGMLGHELRNPLMALTAGLEVLGRGQGGPEEIAAMKRQAGRMGALLDQVLDVGRVVLGRLELAKKPLDVTEVVRVAEETMRSMIEASGHELAVSLPNEGTVFVFGDPLRLVQSLENLLANASKFTPAGGHIWLTVHVTEAEVEISVRDDGVGMQPEVLLHAFDPFTQGPNHLDRAKGGLGLGLALVRTLVEMHGGSVRAQSEGLGKGSEFVITLPRERSARPRPKRRGARGKALSRHRILIAEDEQDAAAMLSRLLTLDGQDVRTVPDGRLALEVARTFRPGLAVLDLGLPQMDGYQLAAKLREEYGDAMFLVALTGYAKNPKRLTAAGFDAHLLKPTEFDSVRDLLVKGGPVDRKLSGAS